jgi:tetratricopeptide (TPR) repeat protein
MEPRAVNPRYRWARRCWLLLALAALCLSAVLTATTTALAEPTEEEEEKGRDLAKEAMSHYKDGEYEEANALFEQARAVYPSGQVLRMSGYTLMALEKWLDAAEMLEKALSTDYKPLLPRDAEHAQDNLNEVMKRLVVVEVISDVAGAQLSIDGGDDVALPHKERLLPGSYTLEVSAADHEPVTKKITVEGGESVQYKLSPKAIDVEPDPVPVPIPKPEPEPDESSDAFGWFPYQGYVGIVAAGLGLATGIVGIGVGAYGTSLRSAVQDNIDAHNTNYDANCSAHRDLCLSDIELINRDGQRAQDHQTVGLALGITGAALFAVGTTLFLMSDLSPLAPDEEGEDEVTARCGAGLLGVSCAGTF